MEKERFIKRKPTEMTDNEMKKERLFIFNIKILSTQINLLNNRKHSQVNLESFLFTTILYLFLL